MTVIMVPSGTESKIELPTDPLQRMNELTNFGTFSSGILFSAEKK